MPVSPILSSRNRLDIASGSSEKTNSRNKRRNIIYN